MLGEELLAVAQGTLVGEDQYIRRDQQLELLLAEGRY